MRTLAVFLVLATLTPVLGTFMILASAAGVKYRPGNFLERIPRFWCGAICRAAGVEIVLHDAHRIAHGEARVYITNHVSWFDVFALAHVLPHYTFIAKSELRKIPFFGGAAEAAGIIFIERQNRKAAFDAYKEAATHVSGGKSVVVCPEGTRGREYPLRPFKKGPFVFAIAAGVPIVPAIIHGTIRVMPKGSFWIRPGRIDIHFLEPVSPVGYDYERRDELMRLVWTQMAEAMQREYGIESKSLPIARERVSRELAPDELPDDLS